MSTNNKKKKENKYTKTNTPCIYLNNWTGCYDAKYNYKVYDPIKKKNIYKQKNKGHFSTIAEAKDWLSNARGGLLIKEDKEVTLKGAYISWLKEAEAHGYTEQTKINCNSFYKMIVQFIDEDTKIKDINEDLYYTLIGECRKKYKPETVKSINATFRKLINMCYRKGYIKDNPLHRCKAIKIKRESNKKVIPYHHFLKINEYLSELKPYKYGNEYRRVNLQLMYNLLYYTGMRIGECLALRWIDFVEYKYESKHKDRGYRVDIKKSMSNKKEKSTKNEKDRSIPIHADMDMMFRVALINHKRNGGSINDRIFNITHSACQIQLKQICINCDLPIYTHHEFRHTFISNMIKQGVPLAVIEKVSGDTQETIIKYYSHLFDKDELLILSALDRVKVSSV